MDAARQHCQIQTTAQIAGTQCGRASARESMRSSSLCLHFKLRATIPLCCRRPGRRHTLRRAAPIAALEDFLGETPAGCISFEERQAAEQKRAPKHVTYRAQHIAEVDAQLAGGYRHTRSFLKERRGSACFPLQMHLYLRLLVLQRLQINVAYPRKNKGGGHGPAIMR